MPENFSTVGALYESAPGTAYVDDLFYSFAVWTFELDVLSGQRRFRLFHQAWFLTSLRSSSEFLRLNRVQVHALHLVSFRLVGVS